MQPVTVHDRAANDDRPNNHYPPNHPPQNSIPCLTHRIASEHFLPFPHSSFRVFSVLVELHR